MAVGFASQGLAYEVISHVLHGGDFLLGSRCSISLMWLGEQITERGIGNGISMLSLLVSLQVSRAPLVRHSSLRGRVI